MNEYELDEDLMYTLSEFFKILSDPTRMKIVYILTKGSLHVQDLANKVGLSQTAVSYQLRILRAAKIVKFRRQGKMIFYAIDDEHVSDIINTATIHLNEE